MRSARRILFALFAFFAAETAANADVVIDRGSEIVLPNNAAYATRLAAEELNFFLKGVLGEALPVVTRRTAGKTAIVLGGGTDWESRHLGGGNGERGTGNGDWESTPARASALRTTFGWESRHLGGDLRVPRDRDAYVIMAAGDAVRIFGNDDDIADVDATAALPDEAIWQPCFRRGTLFGVYAFLERFAGVRMYFPGELGTCVPAADRIAVPECRIEESPAFSVRRYGYADGPVAKELLDVPVGRDDLIAPQMDETDFKRLNWYRLRMETYHLRCCHGAKTHCLSPETWDALYTNACAVIGGALGDRALPASMRNSVGADHRAARDGDPLFDAMPKDGFTWLRHCHCDWCERNIPFSKTDIGFASDLVWRRTAELANRLKTKFPRARVSQMSYIPYVRIPTNDIPDNVDVFVARRGPWAEGTAIGAREKGEVAAWHDKLGRKLSLWNYPDKVDCWNLEMKDIPQLAPRAWASYYRAVAPHVTGAFAESESDRWIYNYLNYYVFSRVCWNPDADVEAILAEHHRLMFGSAAKEMAEFFDMLEQCWMKVVAKPYDTPLGPGVCEAPTDDELRREIYSPQVLSRLSSLVSLASSKVAEGSIEARRIALFRREYLEPLLACGACAPAVVGVPAACDTRHADSGSGTNSNPAIPKCHNSTIPQSHNPAIFPVRIGLIADIHIGDSNDNSDLKRALRLFDAKKADAVVAAGDLTDFGLLSELREVAAAWNEVFPGSRRSDGEPVVRLFHYGDHDTELNFKVRQREVVDKGRWADYIPHIGPAASWELAFGEKFEPVVRRTVKGCEFTLVHFLPDGGALGDRALPCGPVGADHRAARKPWLHVFSQHRMYRGFFARPGRGDEVSWDDGASLACVTNVPGMIAVCGHGHVSAANGTSFAPLQGGVAAIAIPSLYYQIATWLPKPKGHGGSHQALFMIAEPGKITVERLDARTGGKIAPDVRMAEMAGHGKEGSWTIAL